MLIKTISKEYGNYILHVSKWKTKDVILRFDSQNLNQIMFLENVKRATYVNKITSSISLGGKIQAIIQRNEKNKRKQTKTPENLK